MLPLLLGVALAEPLTLSSGLRVALAPVAGESQVQLELRILAGAAEDPPGRSGLAHLTEHVTLMAPTGGPPIPDIEIDGVTSHDDTRFLARLPPEELGLALSWVRGTLAAPPAPLDRAFEAERAVTSREALRATVEEPALRDRALYPPGHPYHLPAAGQPDTLNGLTLADVQGFARTWYRPDTAILVLAGDLPEGALEAVQAALACLSAPATPPAAHLDPPARPAGWPTHHEGPGSERVLLSLAAFPPTVDADALALLASWLELRGSGGGWRVQAAALRHRLATELILRQVPPSPGGLLVGPWRGARQAEARVRALRRQALHLDAQRIAEARQRRVPTLARSAAAVAASIADDLALGPVPEAGDDEVRRAARAWAEAGLRSLVLGP